MKAYVDIEILTKTLIEWLQTDKYKDIVDALNGKTKEEVFRNTCLVLPSLILAICPIEWVKETMPEEGENK